MVTHGRREFLTAASVVARLLRDRDEVLVVAGLGSPSYDVLCGRRP